MDVKARKARRLYNGYLNFSLVDEAFFAWLPQQRSLVFAALPERGDPAVGPRKPVIYEHDRQAQPQRTYQGLLKHEADEALFDYYATSQLKKADVRGRISPLGESGPIASFEPSPDGRYIKVHYVARPYTYTQTFHRFPSEVVVLSQEGREVVRKSIGPVNRPLGRDAAYDVPRHFTWRSDVGATLTWVEAQDGGDPKAESTERDRLFAWAAPFDQAPRLLQSSALRLEAAYWIRDTLAIRSEKWGATRTGHWVLFNPRTGATLDTLLHLGRQGTSFDPGSPVYEKAGGGKRLLFRDGSIYLSRKPVNARDEVEPVLEKLHLRSKRREVVWRSAAPHYEFPVAFEQGDAWIMARQSRTVPINLVRVDLASGKEEVLTFNGNNLEVLQQSLVTQELTYLRADGVPLQATLYYNRDSVRADRLLDCLVFAYPIDHVGSAGGAATYPYRYEASLSLQKLLAYSGYAVLDNAAFPIIGREGSPPNDTYLEQIELNARAAVRAAGGTGLIDTSRMAVMGHSYGAFMVANLLTHTNLFKTGVAMSGAYNRSLTPFGFQREYRSYWEEQALYHRLSPFQNADKLNRPILLFHGERDENAGTHYRQSEAYFAALKGLGKTVRFVSLPGEAHAYTLLDSYLHILWEVDTWLRKHLQDGPPKVLGLTNGN
ncbi:alpha/beta hydrolase family protein [Pontibacter indicus]|uniref:alpha/beta hydrolase family protein n=1 Tax=Pontibacter indicus TaxID=1317125 RepID=UPI00147D3A1B|nr:prolyl oligopeptidase family serine peptidase [Pontibacter indicus]